MPVRRLDPEAGSTPGAGPVSRVLRAGAIPAIDGPIFVIGDAAGAQMPPVTPIRALVVHGQVRTCSLWQQDATRSSTTGSASRSS